MHWDAWVLGPKLKNVPTGLPPATCRPCTRSPLNCSLLIPDRVTAVRNYKTEIEITDLRSALQVCQRSKQLHSSITHTVLATNSLSCMVQLKFGQCNATRRPDSHISIFYSTLILKEHNHVDYTVIISSSVGEMTVK